MSGRTQSPAMRMSAMPRMATANPPSTPMLGGLSRPWPPGGAGAGGIAGLLILPLRCPLQPPRVRRSRRSAGPKHQVQYKNTFDAGGRRSRQGVATASARPRCTRTKVRVAIPRRCPIGNYITATAGLSEVGSQRWRASAARRRRSWGERVVRRAQARALRAILEQAKVITLVALCGRSLAPEPPARSCRAAPPPLPTEDCDVETTASNAGAPTHAPHSCIRERPHPPLARRPRFPEIGAHANTSRNSVNSCTYADSTCAYAGATLRSVPGASVLAHPSHVRTAWHRQTSLEAIPTRTARPSALPFTPPFTHI
eukprot:365369-Chlamydomonas_euryale.AAC.3